MFGSIFYNCWGALVAFSIYFFVTLSQSYTPTHILIGSSICAVIAFVAMYIVRYCLSYIFYTPEDKMFDEFKKENDKKNEQRASENNNTANATVQYNDESSEEIAKVVRTMMNQEEPVRN